MDEHKSLYGTKKLDLSDLIESHMKHLVELTYYKIKDTNQYSVEIVKREEQEIGIKTESEKMNLLTDDEAKVDKIIEILMRNKVTPIGLEECVTEIVKMKMI